MESTTGGDMAPNALQEIDKEYSSNGVSEEEQHYEIIVFRTKKNGSVYATADTDCTVDNCSCEDASVLDNVQKFCGALRTIAECRSHMCPYTLETLLTNEIFNINFKWLELDEDSDNHHPRTGSAASDDNPDNGPNIVRGTNGTTFDEQSSVGDTASSCSSAAVIGSHELPDVSSTTSGDVTSSSTETTHNSSATATSTSSTKQTSVPSNSSDAEYTTSALYLCKSTVENYKNNLVSQQEKDLLSRAETLIIPQGAPDNENLTSNGSTEEHTNSDSIPTTQTSDFNENGQENTASTSASGEENMEISVEKEASSISEALPTISSKHAEAAAFAVPSIPSSLIECVPSNSTLIDSSVETAKNNEVNEDVNGKTSTASHDRSDPRVPTQSVVEAPLNTSNSPAQPHASPVAPSVASTVPSSSESTPVDKSTEEENDSAHSNSTSMEEEEVDGAHDEGIEEEAEGVYESSQTRFQRSGGVSRVWARLGTRHGQSSIASPEDASIEPEKDAEPQRSSDSGEKLEGDKAQGNPNEQPKDDDARISPKPSSQDTPERDKDKADKESDRQEVDTPTIQEGGVTTRSKSNRPAPASVKRQRADRTAKQKAQAKISSALVSSSSNEGSPSTTPTTTLVGKRLRSSDVSHKTPSQTTTDSSTKSKKRQLETRGGDGNEVRSSTSRSNTPTLEEPSNQENVRQLRSSPAPTTKKRRLETTASSSDQEKDAAQISPVEVILEDVDVLSSSDSNDPDTDSGESQHSEWSQLSEVPLKVRLERRKERAENKKRDCAMRARVKLAKKRRKKESLKLPPPSGESSVPKFLLPKAKEVLRRITEKKKTVDDDIEMIEEHPAKSVQQKQNTNVSETSKKTSQVPTSTSNKNPQGGIHIDLKQRAQQLSKSPATSATTTLSCSSNILASIPKPVNIDDELEDGNSWELKGSPSPRKTQQIQKGLADTNTPSSDPVSSKSTTPSSNSQVPQTSNPSPSKRNPATASSTASSDGDAAQSTRGMRAKKAIFDPKMEAVKIKPKPVPKVTKETIQQQRRNSTEVPKQGAASNTDQVEVEIISPQVRKESPASQTCQQLITIPGICDEPTPTPSSSEKEQQKSQTPQKNPNAREKSVGQTSKPKNTNLSLVDGEIRALPKSGTSNSSAAERVSGGGTWIRGDAIDFETAPGDNEDRRRGTNQSNMRPDNRSNSDSRFRGGPNRHGRGGYQQQYGNYPGDFGPMHHGRYEGPRGPRPPFRGHPGGPPRNFESDHPSRSVSRSRDRDPPQRNGHHRDYRRN